MRVMNIAATGMMAQQLNVEVISNNIANMNTTAFKRARAEFQDLMYETARRQGAFSSDSGTIVPVGIEVGLGVKPAAVARIHTQGNLAPTGNKLDMALEGRGYFAVVLPTGEEAYTRAGSFQLSAEGTLVTVDGYTVAPGLTVPENTREIVVNSSGEVMVYTDGAPDPQNLGQLTLVTFTNEAGLEALGDNLYRQTPASGAPLPGVPGQQGFATVRQGYVESSNVNIVQEITNLISAQRAYEMNSKVVETADQMLSTTTNMR